MKMIITCLAICLLSSIAYGQGNTRKTKVCLIHKGVLQEVEGTYNNQTGEHKVMLDGVAKDVEQLHVDNPDYAQSVSWYINNDSLKIEGSAYVKYGLPRILATNEVRKYTSYKGVGVYIDAAEKNLTDVIYIPVRGQCEFQPYQRSWQR